MPSCTFTAQVGLFCLSSSTAVASGIQNESLCAVLVLAEVLLSSRLGRPRAVGRSGAPPLLGALDHGTRPQGQSPRGQRAGRRMLAGTGRSRAPERSAARPGRFIIARPAPFPSSGPFLLVAFASLRPPKTAFLFSLFHAGANNSEEGKAAGRCPSLARGRPAPSRKSDEYDAQKGKKAGGTRERGGRPASTHPSGESLSPADAPPRVLSLSARPGREQQVGRRAGNPRKVRNACDGARSARSAKHDTPFISESTAGTA